MLSLNFRPPFTTVPKMQTALTKKFLQLSFQANSEDTCFSVKNPQVSCENSSQTTLRLVNSPNEILVSDFPNLIGVYLYLFILQTLKRHSASSFIWEVSTETEEALPDELKLKFQVNYGQDMIFEDTPFDAHFDFKDFKVSLITPYGLLGLIFMYFQTLYLLKCRIDPTKGGSELCKASSICSLSISLQQINHSSYTSLMYEVTYQNQYQTFFSDFPRARGFIYFFQQNYCVFALRQTKDLVACRRHHRRRTVELKYFGRDNEWKQ